MIDALLTRLDRDAEAEIARVTAESEAAAAAISARAEERVTARRRDALARLDREHREALDHALTAARHAARARVLAARDQMLARVFAALDAILPEVAASRAYRAALGDEVGAALAYVGDQSAVLRCEPALAALVKRLGTTNGRVTIRPDPAVRAGFRLVTEGGALEVDGTLGGRAARLWPRLALEALAALQDDKP